RGEIERHERPRLKDHARIVGGEGQSRGDAGGERRLRERRLEEVEGAALEMRCPDGDGAKRAVGKKRSPQRDYALPAAAIGRRYGDAGVAEEPPLQDGERNENDARLLGAERDARGDGGTDRPRPRPSAPPRVVLQYEEPAEADDDEQLGPPDHAADQIG